MTTESDEEKVPLRFMLRENIEISKKTSEEVSNLKGDMTKVKTIVLGDPDAEIPGLAQRMNKVEKDKKVQNKIMAIISAISAGVGVVIAWLIEHGAKFFKAVAPVILIYGDFLLLLIWIVAVALLN